MTLLPSRKKILLTELRALWIQGSRQCLQINGLYSNITLIDVVCGLYVSKVRYMGARKCGAFAHKVIVPYC